MSFTEFDFLVDGEPRKISVEIRDGTLVAREGGRILEAEVRKITANELQFRFGGRSVRVHLVRYGEQTFVSVDGREFVLSESSPETCRRGKGDEKTAEKSLRVRSPMPGKVTKIAVVEGEGVRKYQTLLIVEAMKMENEINTTIDGVVTKIHVAVGDLVDSEKTLIEVENR
jgi:glutaconyl-CoA/methylmalonyl-CoA decarboxylase subunit gamma